MGTLAKAVRMAPAQAESLERALRKYRRKVAWNMADVAITTTTATNVLALTVPANELEIGSTIHVHVSGTILNDTGATTNCTVRFLLEDNGLDLHDDVTAVLADPGTAEPVAFLYEARIHYAGLADVRVDGRLTISTDGAAAAATGTGSFDTAQGLINAVFTGASTSGQLTNDHLITLNVTLGAAAGATFALTKKVAVLEVG